MIARSIILVGLASAVAIEPAHAAPGGNGNGNGNGFGIGFGGGNAGGNGNGNAFGQNGTLDGANNGGPTGSVGGVPLPGLGATLLGQAVGVSGLLVLWRRRRKSRKDAPEAR